MNIYSSENEQLDTIRRFFINNGKILVASLLIGILCLIGWHYWNSYQTSNDLETSAHYQQLLSTVDTEKSQTLTALSQFANKDNSTYSVFAALNLAKHYVALNQLDKAYTLLERGLSIAKDDGLKALVALRLARIKLYQNQPNEALKLLENVKSSSWAAMVANVRGDILLKKGDKSGAITAWSSRSVANTPPALAQIMQMKKDNIN